MIINGLRIYTLDNGRIASSMTVEKGRIKELREEPIQAGIRGYILPGFIDSHVHLLDVGLRSVFPFLQGAECLEDIYERLLDGYKRAKDLGFIVGWDFEEERIREKRVPHREELDRVVKEIPLIVLRRDGHSSFLNTKSFERIFKEEYSGIELDKYKEPTGVVRGEANEEVLRYIRRNLPREVIVEAYTIASQEAISKGITTLAALVGSDDPEDKSCEILLEIRDKLKIDTIPFYQTTDIDRVRRLGLERIGGCILIDGSFGSHTAALRQGYKDDPENRGVLYFSDEELFRFLKSADDASLQTAVHAIGDRAVEQVVKVYERFLRDNPLRHRIEHAELLDEGLIERIARLGLILSVQPTFERLWGKNMYRERLGERADKTNPFKRLIEAGVLIIGGSDAPITPLDPLLGISSATNHPNPSLSLSRLEAIELFTTKAAYGIFKEGEIGRLKTGFWADFCVLDSDPLKGEAKILEVYKKGERVFP